MEKDDIFTRTPADSDERTVYLRGRAASPTAYLAGVILLLAGVYALVWCFTGKIRQSISVLGIVFPQYGIAQIKSRVEGQVSYIQVKVGDNVEVGDLIAIIPQTELLDRLEAASPSAREALYREYQNMSFIRTPVSGRVVDLIQSGDVIHAGDRVAGVTCGGHGSNEKEIRTYVPMASARTMKKGGQVRIYPDSSSGERYGYMEGLISEISTYPITRTGISEDLGRFYNSESIAAEDNIVEVRVTLLGAAEDAKTDLPELDIGTQCRMEVILRETTPWQYLFS